MRTPAKRRTAGRKAPGTFQDLPFSERVVVDPELARARARYAGAPPAERRAAAQWVYDADVADGLFSQAAAMAAQGAGAPASRCEEGYLALAIDPQFAPALLTVGSVEYQLGRVDSAMVLFLAIVALPEEPDWAILVDKAGGFLLDADDNANAQRLYQAAVDAGPEVAAFWSGLGYCHARLGAKQAAVDAARRTVACSPRDSRSLSDLGWALLEAGQAEEARAVLEEAVALAPPGYDLPAANLAELDARVSPSTAARHFTRGWRQAQPPIAKPADH